MGFKKGRAARTTAARTCDNSRSTLNIQHDGDSCVSYLATNGFEYKIDVVAMEQVNIKRGTCRAVYRRPNANNFMMWLFEADLPSNAHSSTMPILYPKWVTFALEERWRAVQTSSRASPFEGKVEEWRQRLAKLDDASLHDIFSCFDAADVSGAGSVPPHPMHEISLQVEADRGLCEALFEQLLHSGWPAIEIASSLQWLVRKGLQPTPTHCRKIALQLGSLLVLRVLLIECRVDVCGLEIITGGDGASAKLPASVSAGSAGWVQHSKAALKALLARGAVLGNHVSRSKLLKRLEEDGNILWAERILQSMASSENGLPDFVIDRIGSFL